MNHNTLKRYRYWSSVGARMERNSPQYAVKSLMLALGVFVMTLGVAFAGIVTSTYEARLERDYARTPANLFSSADMVNEGPRWRIISDSAGGRWVQVIALVPGPGVEPPPGLSHWPEPGEVILSPALSGTSRGNEIADRYGVDKGRVIEPDGLASSSERIAYFRPSDEILDNVYGIPLQQLGITTPVDLTQPGFFGGTSYQRSLSSALFGYALAALLPSMVVLLVTIRSGSMERDRQAQIFGVLGANSRTLAALIWGGVSRPLITGGVGAFAVIAVMSIFDVTVPFVEYTIRAKDVRDGLPLILMAGLLGWLLTLLAVVSSFRLRKTSGTRPLPKSRKESNWKLLLLPIACVASVQMVAVTARFGDSPVRILTIYAAILLVALSLPAFVGAMSSLLAKIMVYTGRSTRSAGLIVAGRQILEDPQTTRRLGSGMALLILLIAHAYCLSTMTNAMARDAISVRDEFGTSVLNINGPTRSPEHASATREALSGKGEILALSTTFSVEKPPTGRIVASCDTLSYLGFPCDSTRLDKNAIHSSPQLALITGSAGLSSVSVEVADPLELVSPAESDVTEFYALGVADESTLMGIRQDLAHSLITPPFIAPIGTEWIDGLAEGREQARWNTVGASVATALLGIAIIASVIGDSASQSRQVGMLATYGARAPFILVTVFGRVFIPLLIAITTGCLVAFVTTSPYSVPPMSAELPSEFYVATTTLPLCAAVAFTAMAAWGQFVAFTRWRSGLGT